MCVGSLSLTVKTPLCFCIKRNDLFSLCVSHVSSVSTNRCNFGDTSHFQLFKLKEQSALIYQFSNAPIQEVCSELIRSVFSVELFWLTQGYAIWINEMWAHSLVFQSNSPNSSIQLEPVEHDAESVGLSPAEGSDWARVSSQRNQNNCEPIPQWQWRGVLTENNVPQLREPSAECGVIMMKWQKIAEGLLLDWKTF